MTRTATFEYLGVAGWLIRRGKDAVLTAPFFTNPSPLRVLFRRVAPDRCTIARHIAGRVDDVRVVVAGHAHYDHIMDLPVVAEHLHPEAVVFGDETVCNSLGKTFPRERFIITGPCELGNVRLTPIASEHGPHLGRWRFMRGHYRKPLDAPPPRPVKWREGQTLAFLIDFLDDRGKPDLRVYYNDTAPSLPHGLPDEATLKEKAVDVAILAVSSFRRQRGYPAKYLERMNPRHVLLGHWENFFRPADLPMEALRPDEVRAFIEQMPLGRFSLPERHTLITVNY